jgi:hypothetical protein
LLCSAILLLLYSTININIHSLYCSHVYYMLSCLFLCFEFYLLYLYLYVYIKHTTLLYLFYMCIGAIGKGTGAYSPDPINISVGDTVQWTNNDSGIPHTVTSGSASGFSNSPLSSPTISSGQTFQFTFNNPGTFTYGCSIHGKQCTVKSFTLYTYTYIYIYICIHI